MKSLTAATYMFGSTAREVSMDQRYLLRSFQAGFSPQNQQAQNRKLLLTETNHSIPDTET